jgi:peptidoglycan/xylan/chitin deacetylase (PgdA/CDA1 family)
LPREPKPTEAINTQQTDQTSVNKNVNRSVNTNNNQINTNTATEPISEVTNTAVKEVEAPAGTRPEITRIDTTKKQVVLTFDAGSGNQSVQEILDALEKYHLSAAFFLTGKWAEKNPDFTKKISEAGHEIFNHTFSHPHLTQITDDEIASELQKAETAIKNITGQSTKPYFRAPYGERNAHVLEITAQQGYRSVYWTVDALDWQESEGMTAELVKKRIFSKLAPGTIYLMHVGDTLTGQILEDVIEQMQDEGYDIVPLDQNF